MKLSEAAKFVTIVYNDLLKQSDVIVCLEGDGYVRAIFSAELYHKKLANKILMSGGSDNPPFSIPANLLAKKIEEHGVPKEAMYLEEKSQNTWEQAYNVMAIAKEKKWKKLILVASHFHQPRAYVTFLQAMKKAKLALVIYNAPVRNLKWHEKVNKRETRLQLLENEFKKFDHYKKKRHIVSIASALAYQRWKENHA